MTVLAVNLASQTSVSKSSVHVTHNVDTHRFVRPTLVSLDVEETKTVAPALSVCKISVKPNPPVPLMQSAAPENTVMQVSVKRDVPQTLNVALENSVLDTNARKVVSLIAIAEQANTARQQSRLASLVVALMLIALVV
tara:strand:- start:166 stop:579 length:414 start_codon:yes stop_codon:yes gene_type:complete